MAENLNGHTIAFVATNGVEQVELTSPWEAVKNAGATPVLVSDKQDSITAMQGDWDHRDSFTVDRNISERKSNFDSVVLPGGTLNADTLRTNDDVLNFVGPLLRSRSQSHQSATGHGCSSMPASSKAAPLPVSTKYPLI